MRYISALLLKQNQTRRKLASIHYRSPLPFALLFAKRKKEKEKTPAKNRILISELEHFYLAPFNRALPSPENSKNTRKEELKIIGRLFVEIALN